MASSRCVFSQIEPNWPLPYSTVPVPLLRDAIGRQAGSPVSIFVQVQCRWPKTGQEKVQFSRKTKYSADLGYNLSMHLVLLFLC